MERILYHLWNFQPEDPEVVKDLFLTSTGYFSVEEEDRISSDYNTIKHHLFGSGKIPATSIGISIMHRLLRCVVNPDTGLLQSLMKEDTKSASLGLQLPVQLMDQVRGYRPQAPPSPDFTVWVKLIPSVGHQLDRHLPSEWTLWLRPQEQYAFVFADQHWYTLGLFRENAGPKISRSIGTRSVRKGLRIVMPLWANSIYQLNGALAKMPPFAKSNTPPAWLDIGSSSPSCHGGRKTPESMISTTKVTAFACGAGSVARGMVIEQPLHAGISSWRDQTTHSRYSTRLRQKLGHWKMIGFPREMVILLKLRFTQTMLAWFASCSLRDLLASLGSPTTNPNMEELGNQVDNDSRPNSVTTKVSGVSVTVSAMISPSNSNSSDSSVGISETLASTVPTSPPSSPTGEDPANAVMQGMEETVEQDHSESDDEEELEVEKAEPQDQYRLGGYHPLKLREVVDSRYEVMRKLGWGEYSTVWLVKSRASETYAAMKVMKGKSSFQIAVAYTDVIQPGSPTYLSCTRSTTYVDLHLLDQFYVHGSNGKHMCLVTELLGEGLDRYAKRFPYQQLPIKLIQTVMRQVILAVSYLHEKCNILHTDIKSNNILLVDGILLATPTIPTEVTVKLIDLGVACWADRVEEHFTDLIQSPELRAPEVCVGAGWGKAADIWSLGLLVYELATGSFLIRHTVHAESIPYIHAIYFGPYPRNLTKDGKYSHFFKEDGTQLIDVEQGWIPLADKIRRLRPPGDSDTEGLIEFLDLMLRLDPAERATLQTLLEHPWLASD
ncbi:kinase-like domain-containing protein [Mycena amicta]|nr:kinase-like domain-containing protein [Mycena amicta]